MKRRQKTGVKADSLHTPKDESNTDTTEKDTNRWKSLLGFDPRSIRNWTSLVGLLNEPRDPASLAVTRILFGLLMVIDIPQERGMAHLDARFGDAIQCQFPLFNSLKPLPVDWMYLAYLFMLCGALGICVGLFYKLSCVIFFIPYWYIFFLDKTVWNNHSYLYALVGFQLTWLDANRCWSLDSVRNPKLRNKHVPLWNYAILRTQIFIVYFIAGLKKLDKDWMHGYSMSTLSRSWVFDPFKFLLTEDQIDLYIVHLGGLSLDLFGGFLMFFDKTRPFAFIFIGMFHAMNSQLFSIGMFPYAMLATMPLFCYVDWPRRLLAKMPVFIKKQFATDDVTFQPSEHCIYSEDHKEVKTLDNPRVQDVTDKMKCAPVNKKSSHRPGWYHHIASSWFVIYLCIQFFMPYSHFITKGYNNWTDGLYGYSWDMMVHSWHTQHIKIKYVEKGTGEEGYLSPTFFSQSSRWASHPDMTKQFAMCVSNRLQHAGFNEIEVYFDIWKSVNDRFQQRMINPLEDMVKADWSPFEQPKWNMPLLTDLSDWRTKLKKMEEELGDGVDVTFVADFPGLFLENYLSEDFDNASITVLSGKVKVQLVHNETNITLSEGEKLQLPVGTFHNVHTISREPSTYMYLFVNQTDVEFTKNVTEALHPVGGTLEDLMDGKLTSDMLANITDQKLANEISNLNSQNLKKKRGRRKLSIEQASQFLEQKARIIQNTFSKTRTALGHVLFGFESVMESAERDMGATHSNSESQTRVSSEL